jgi:hypothetical protein
MFTKEALHATSLLFRKKNGDCILSSGARQKAGQEAETSKVEHVVQGKEATAIGYRTLKPLSAPACNQPTWTQVCTHCQFGCLQRDVPSRNSLCIIDTAFSSHLAYLNYLAFHWILCQHHLLRKAARPQASRPKPLHEEASLKLAIENMI